MTKHEKFSRWAKRHMGTWATAETAGARTALVWDADEQRQVVLMTFKPSKVTYILPIVALPGLIQSLSEAHTEAIKNQPAYNAARSTNLN